MNFNFSGSSGLPIVMALLSLLWMTAVVVLHILFALCVWADVNWLRQQGRPIVLMPPFVWSLASLILGLVAVAFYWVCHYSRFGRRDV